MASRKEVERAVSDNFTTLRAPIDNAFEQIEGGWYLLYRTSTILRTKLSLVGRYKVADGVTGIEKIFCTTQAITYAIKWGQETA